MFTKTHSLDACGDCFPDAIRAIVRVAGAWRNKTTETPSTRSTNRREENGNFCVTHGRSCGGSIMASVGGGVKVKDEQLAEE